MIDNSNWLITGGAGFLGLHICNNLVKKKQKVISYDIAKMPECEKPEGLIEIVADIRDKHILKKALRNVDYVVGDSVSDQIHLAKTIARNRALNALGQTVSTELSSKSKETIRQAGIGEDQVSKTEINLISSTVMDEVTLSGYETVETKLVSLDNGSYRAFILLKYPVAKAYKSYIEKIDKSPELKGRLTKIKNTDIYKELENAVAQYSGS